MAESPDKSKLTWLDKAVAFISPKAGMERLAYRQALGLQAAYTGAISNRVSTSWSQSESMGGLPHLNLQVARSMRDRARSLCENNVLASSILERATENIVGNGFQVQPLTADGDWNKRAKLLFNNWAKTADFHNRSWVQHQKLHCKSFLRDGDVGSAMLSKGQLQLFEGDYVSSPYDKPNAFLHDGVELDKYGRAAIYYVMSYVDQRNREWRPVPAKYFLFCKNESRVTQYRGETKFASSFQLFDSMQGYLDAVVLAQKIAACLAIFITRNDLTGSLQGLGTTNNSQNQSQRSMVIEPGMIQTLNTNESIEQTNPAQPGSGFDANMRMLIRLLGLSFGLPLEYVLCDWSTVSGATAKASALCAQRAFEAIQKQLIDEYYARVYCWKIQSFIDAGELEDREDALLHHWHAEPWPYLDRVAELKAIQMAIDTGLSTERRENMAVGNNPDQIREERREELEYKRANNIPIYHSTTVQEIGVKAPLSTEESDGAPDNNTVDASGTPEQPTKEAA